MSTFEHWPFIMMKKPPGATIFTRWEKDPENLIEYITMLRQRYGDVARVSTFPKVYTVSDPVEVERILLTEADNFKKEGFFYKRLARGLGNGIVTSNGELWQQSRQLLQPQFKWGAVKQYGKMMQHCITKRISTWDKKIKKQKPINLAQEMMSAVLENSGQILFGEDLTPKLQRLLQMASIANKFIIQGFPLPKWFPTPGNIRFTWHSHWLHRQLCEMIQKRQQNPTDSHDLLNLLIEAYGDENKQFMDEQQLMNEVRTFLLTGHDTTGNLLSWACYLLSTHPDIMAQLQQEIRTVLGDRPVTVDDLPNLAYVSMVLDESLRLYPPAWGLIRQAQEDTIVKGYHIPKSTNLLIATYLLHRHPDYWEKPNEFIPERFAKDNKAIKHKCAFIPFGIGQRNCMGSHFAMLQAKIFLITLMQKYSLTYARFKPVEPLAFISLKPKQGVWCYLNPINSL